MCLYGEGCKSMNRAREETGDWETFQQQSPRAHETMMELKTYAYLMPQLSSKIQSLAAAAEDHWWKVGGHHC